LHLHLCGCVFALQVITPLLRILEKMHNMMLLHRDIKPENIFLTGMGKFKLGDFGLAIRFDKELAFSRSGTLDYMAPEVRGVCAGGCGAGVLDRLAVCNITGLPCCGTQPGTLRLSAGISHMLCAEDTASLQCFFWWQQQQ
jgi:serine/threonine protein kinase